MTALLAPTELDHLEMVRAVFQSTAQFGNSSEMTSSVQIVTTAQVVWFKARWEIAVLRLLDHNVESRRSQLQMAKVACQSADQCSNCIETEKTASWYAQMVTSQLVTELVACKSALIMKLEPQMEWDVWLRRWSSAQEDMSPITVRLVPRLTVDQMPCWTTLVRTASAETHMSSMPSITSI